MAKKLKKTILLFLVLIFLTWPSAIADAGMSPVTTYVVNPEEPAVDLPENVTQEAGITPDSPLYGLERAIERINLALTFGKSAKAKKGLAHARERLMEVQVMIAQKRFEAASEAQEGYDEIIEDVEENVDEFEDDDAEQELTDSVELEQAINEHRTLVQEINNIKLKIKDLTTEQQTQINNIISSMENSTARAQVSVRVRKNKTKTKIKATRGLSDEEINALEMQIKSAVGEDAQVKIAARKSESKAVGKVISAEDNKADNNKIQKGKALGKTGSKGKKK